MINMCKKQQNLPILKGYKLKSKINLHLIKELKNIIYQAKQDVVTAVNTTMVKTYWEIGRMIVEDEQEGEKRAKYGKAQLQTISRELTKEFGRGFDVTNLRNMRRFYITFPI